MQPPSVMANDLEFSYPPGRGEKRPFTLTCPRWEVLRGARVGVTGPSGSGKSTLLNLVSGTLRPTRGVLQVEGRDLAAMGDVERRAHRIQKIGFVFQDFPLVGYLDAEENVLLPYRLNAALSLDREVRDRVSRLLDRLGLDGMRKRRPSQMSQGEQQRVAIARALITDPALLLADEPTAGLDPDRGARVMDLLDLISEERNLTLVMVTHDPLMLERFGTVLDIGGLAGATERRG